MIIRKISSKENLSLAKILSIFIVFCLIISVTTFTRSVEAKAATPSMQGTAKLYMIKSKFNNLYLDIPSSTLSPTQVILSNRGGTLNQIFKIENATEGGYYKVKNLNSLMVFDVRGLSTSKDAPIDQYYDNNTMNQQFAFQPQDDGSFKIKARNSGLYLTVYNDNMNPGAQLIQWTYKTSSVDNQKWYLEEVTNPFNSLSSYVDYKVDKLKITEVGNILGGAERLGFQTDYNSIQNEVKNVINGYKPQTNKTYMFKSKFNNLYLDIPDASFKAATQVKLWNKSGNLNQQFKIQQANEENYYKIRNVNSEMVFDVRNFSTNKDAPIDQYYDNNTINQQFAFEHQADGSYKIKAKNSGLYLTVYNDNMSPGAQLIQWTNKETSQDNQKWYLEEIANQYGNLANFVEYKVIQRKILNIDNILASALSLGIVADYNSVQNEMNNVLNKNNDQVFTNSTGFITTFGMLDKKINQIGFAGAHNAFSNNQDRRSSYAWDTYTTYHNIGTENNDISIRKMLDVGYRVIDLDIGDNGNGKTGSYHRYRLSGYSNLVGDNGILNKVNEFLTDNPGEIAIIHLSDVYNGQLNLASLRSNSTYNSGTSEHTNQVNNMLNAMKSIGLLEQVYNYTGTNETKHDNIFGLMTKPGVNAEWPTLKQMLQSNKRLFFVTRDNGFGTDIGFNTTVNDPSTSNEQTVILDEKFMNNLRGESANKSVNLTLTRNYGASAGDKGAAAINNEGRRLYSMLNKINSTIKSNGISKSVNTVFLDYATGNKFQGGWLDVSPVDAVNRANYDNFGYNWNSSIGIGYWK